MADGSPSASAASQVGGPVARLRRWLLLDAPRALIAGGLLASTVLLIAGLGWADLIGVTRVGPVRSLFGAIVTGVFTVVSIVLAINQLVLSRVFGSPAALTDRMEGNVAFRDRVADDLDRPTAPTDPQAFIQALVDALGDRVDALRVDDEDVAAAADLSELADDIDGYAATVGDRLEGRDFGTFAVLSAILRDDYSENVRAARALRREHGDALPDATVGALEDVVTLLESVGIARQYFKTLYIQQELAGLSRRLLYLGIPALVTGVVTILAYARPAGPPLSGVALTVAVALAVGLSVSPLMVLFAAVLRLATIARLTSTVGPFTPREERAE
jgi:hypothetical protein